jgi:hypothetical protein
MVTSASHEPPGIRRELVWVETKGFLGWGCSECAWKFNPEGMPAGATIAEMKQHYQQQRDDEFQSHRCADYPAMQAPSRPSKSQPKSKAMKRP